ncbi:hypothetical protein JXM67_13215 [candidate division WOR-3 bacterium]|nr:hypothetical protein [candidate division WOR-3 bacterium]
MINKWESEMMKRHITFAILVIAALSCKKEEPRTLRIYRNGEFEREVDVTGWEVNEDVIELGMFYYPWQGEDSIDYRGCYFHGFKKYVEEHPYHLLEVNGTVTGSIIDMLWNVQDCKKILTVVYDLGSSPPPEKYNLESLMYLPNLIGVSVRIDSVEDFKKLDSIPSHLRIYVTCNRVTEEAFEKMSRYNNIRVLEVKARWDSISYSGVKHLWRLKDLRYLVSLYPIPFVGFDSTHFPKLRSIDSFPLPPL